MLASLTETEHAVVVTEPTLSGFHDAGRVADLIGHFGIPAGLVVNKWDINPERSRDIETLCDEEGVAFWGESPFRGRSSHR